MLTGCAGHFPCAGHVPLPKSSYNWQVPTRIMTKIIKPHLPSLPIKGSFSIDHNAAITRAYRQLIKRGVATVVHSNTLRTIAYDPYAHPILACSPLHLCIVQLETG